MIRASFFAGLFVLTAVSAGAEDRQAAATLDRAARVRMQYLLALPEGYADDESQDWPLLLFLHGSGERGDDLKLVEKHGPPKLIAGGKSLPFVVVSPQCPAGRRWSAFELEVLLDEIVANQRIDENRVYVTGLSMGGFGTWALAARNPGRFAAIAPICGGGEAYWGRQLKTVPVWAFHGARDKAVPLARSEAMVEAVKRAGGDAKLTVYPEAGHDSWTESYENAALYEWLLSHRRASTK